MEDCGRLINPLIVDGQVRGGVAQGIGAALYEEVIYDHGGQLVSGTLMDYLVPSAAEVVKMESHHLETPSPTTLGGFRGMGEGGTIGDLQSLPMPYPMRSRRWVSRSMSFRLRPTACDKAYELKDKPSRSVGIPSRGRLGWGTCDPSKCERLRHLGRSASRYRAQWWPHAV